MGLKLYVIFSYTRDPPAVQMVSITGGKKRLCWYARKDGAGSVWEKLPGQPACLQTNRRALPILPALGIGEPCKTQKTLKEAPFGTAAVAREL